MDPEEVQKTLHPTRVHAERGLNQAAIFGVEANRKAGVAYETVYIIARKPRHIVREGNRLFYVLVGVDHGRRQPASRGVAHVETALYNLTVDGDHKSATRCVKEQLDRLKDLKRRFRKTPIKVVDQDNNASPSHLKVTNDIPENLQKLLDRLHHVYMSEDGLTLDNTCNLLNVGLADQPFVILTSSSHDRS